MASKIAGHSNKPWDELPVLPMDKVNTLMLSTAPLGISLFFSPSFQHDYLLTDLFQSGKSQ